MSLNDIITLAKQGYKPSDIKELIELASNVDNVNNQVDNQQTDEEPQGNVIADETLQNDSINTSTGEENTNNNTSQLNPKDEQIKELERKLAAAQSMNLHQDISNNIESDESILENLVRSFM